MSGIRCRIRPAIASIKINPTKALIIGIDAGLGTAMAWVDGVEAGVNADADFDGEDRESSVSLSDWTRISSAF